MCVHQVLVDPLLSGGRKLGEIELTGADLELLVLARDRVAVDVDVVERVVGANRLELFVGVLERRVVPQPKVVDGDLVVLHFLQGEGLVAGEVAHSHVGEPICGAGAGDLAHDVWNLVRLRARRDEKALHDAGIDLSDQQHGDPDAGCGDRQPQAPQPSIHDERSGEHDSSTSLERIQRQPCIDVGVRGAPHDGAVVRVHQVVTAEPRPDREGDGKYSEND